MRTEQDIVNRIKTILRDTLSLGAKAEQMNADTRLMGALAEFDSMAVVTVITALEDAFDITIADDDLSADVFESVGSLAKFVAAKADM
jgi:acyl carrier protein